MKGLSWDKFRRLMGGRKKDEQETDSSQFQRSYSFKRTSVRKSGRRVAGLSKGQCSSKNASNPSRLKLGESLHEAADCERDERSLLHTRRESFDYDTNFNVENVAGLGPLDQYGRGLSENCYDTEYTQKLENVEEEMTVRDNSRREVYDEGSDEDSNNQWVPMMRPPEVMQNIGRRQRTENIRKLLSKDLEEDSDWVDCGFNRKADGRNQSESRSKAHDKLENAHKLEEDDVEIASEEFYLSMLAESPKLLKRSTDSALSHLTLESGASNTSQSRAKSRVESDYSRNDGNKCGSRSKLNTSSVLNLVEESENSLVTLVHKSDRSNLKDDSDKYNDDVTLDKNLSLLDSGCYIYNSGKLSINTSGSSGGSFPKEMDTKNSSGGRALDPSLEREIISVSLKTDENPRSFWWTQKPGSTMTTSSGASRDSGFSLGRSWAWGIASKMFGRKGGGGSRGLKGPVLSVSKEGYFQRTNLKRASSRRPTYAIRSSVAKRTSAKLRRSGRRRKISQNPCGPLGDSRSVLDCHPDPPMPDRVCNDFANVQQTEPCLYQHCISVRNTILPIDPFIFVPPEKRRSRHPDIAARFRRACEIRFPFPGGSQNQIEIKENHRFESLDIRLPRLRCESRSENVVITKVVKPDGNDDDDDGVCKAITIGAWGDMNSTAHDKVADDEEINDEDDNETDYEDADDCDADSLCENPENAEATKSYNKRSYMHEKENLKPMKRRASSRKTKGVKVIAKPSAMAVYRRHSTLYRRGKLGPDFALPRPNVKSGKMILPHSAFFDESYCKLLINLGLMESVTLKK
jgi:hypothetical protein